MSSVGPPGDGEGERRQAEADGEQVPAGPRLDEDHDRHDEGGEGQDEQQGGVVEADVLGEEVHVFFFPGRPVLMNANRSRNHWRTQAEATRDLRTAARYEALRARLRRIERCEVHSYPTYRTRRSWPDVGAWAPAVKAVVDGLVDAKVLEDDTHEVVMALHFWAPRLGERDGLVVEIHPISP